MVVTEKQQSAIQQINLFQLVKLKPEFMGIVLEAFELLMYQNAELSKIAARYSHDLRSPVTNINMLLQLYDKSDIESDKHLYVNKISSSLDRLQDGFELLSNDRKNSLKRKTETALINLPGLVDEIKSKLPEGVTVLADFDTGKDVWGLRRYLYNALLLLCSLSDNKDSSYTIQLSSRKSWEGVQCIIKYPENLGLKTILSPDNFTSDDKNRESVTQIMGWNYYFALLFLGAMGAGTQIEESQQGTNSEIIISFTQ